MKSVINSFENEFDFLSNFFPCKIEYEGIVYPSVEHAYQAMKTNSFYEKQLISEAGSPAAAKRLGKSLKMRTDWEEVKEGFMLDFLRIKFSQSYLKQRLIGTLSYELIEGNNWHDNYWGDCYCDKCKFTVRGKNRLGFLLMRVREEVTCE